MKKSVNVFCGLDAALEASKCKYSSLIIYVITFEVTQPIRAQYLIVTDRRRDRRTDGQTERIH